MMMCHQTDHGDGPHPYSAATCEPDPNALAAWCGDAEPHEEHYTDSATECPGYPLAREAAPIEHRPDGTPNGFFLTLRPDASGALTVVHCLVHEAAITTWQPGPAFAGEDEAREFIRSAFEWYSQTGPTVPTRCVFKHPEGRELTPAERGQR